MSISLTNDYYSSSSDSSFDKKTNKNDTPSIKKSVVDKIGKKILATSSENSSDEYSSDIKPEVKHKSGYIAFHTPKKKQGIDIDDDVNLTQTPSPFKYSSPKYFINISSHKSGKIQLIETPKSKQKIKKLSDKSGGNYVVRRLSYAISPNKTKTLKKVADLDGSTGNVYNRLKQYISDANNQGNTLISELLKEDLIKNQNTTPNTAVKWQFGIYDKNKNPYLDPTNLEEKNWSHKKEIGRQVFNVKTPGGGSSSYAKYKEAILQESGQKKLNTHFKLKDPEKLFKVKQLSNGRFKVKLPRAVSKTSIVAYGFFDSKSKKCLYAGFASKTGRRLSSHICNLNSRKGPLYKAYKDYQGKDKKFNLSFGIIHKMEKTDDPKALENAVIAKFKPKHNGTKGGNGGFAHPNTIKTWFAKNDSDSELDSDSSSES